MPIEVDSAADVEPIHATFLSPNRARMISQGVRERQQEAAERWEGTMTRRHTHVWSNRARLKCERAGKLVM